MMLKPSHTPSLPPYLSLLLVFVYLLITNSDIISFTSLFSFDTELSSLMRYSSIVTPSWVTSF
jgi:hypothetical protein